MPEPGAGRVLALDWGTKRFGVALSDPTRLLAQPLTTLTRRPGHRPPVREILDLITRHEVVLVVVGLPLTPAGEEGDAAAEARALGEAVARRSGVPVTWWDERLSTAAALRSARAAGVRDRDSRERIDQLAATQILQHFLDAQTHRRTDAQEMP
ncbi:MAG: Holliday junction resolvase RuvX [Gemmatimonadales bacterium]